MNVPATDAVCVAEPLTASGPVHGLPVAPPPLALQLLAVGTCQLSMKLEPTMGAGLEFDKLTPGPMMTVTLAVAGGCVGSMLGHEME